MGNIYLEKKNTLNKDEKKIFDFYNKEHNIIYFSLKQIQRNKIDFEDVFLIAGSYQSMLLLLKKYTNHSLEFDSYPYSIREYAKRKIWKTTLGEAELDYKRGINYFIKPYSNLKSFTGFLIQESSYFQSLHKVLNKYKRSYEIYASEIFHISSEYRVYVIDNKLESISYYYGDNEIVLLDTDFIEEVIEAYSKDKDNINSYAIDFAIDFEGNTRLLELNEGFSIDSYLSSEEVYSKLVKKRFDMLFSNSLLLK